MLYSSIFLKENLPATAEPFCCDECAPIYDLQCLQSHLRIKSSSLILLQKFLILNLARKSETQYSSSLTMPMVQINQYTGNDTTQEQISPRIYHDRQTLEWHLLWYPCIFVQQPVAWSHQFQYESKCIHLQERIWMSALLLCPAESSFSARQWSQTSTSDISNRSQSRAFLRAYDQARSPLGHTRLPDCYSSQFTVSYFKPLCLAKLSCSNHILNFLMNFWMLQLPQSTANHTVFHLALQIITVITWIPP